MDCDRCGARNAEGSNYCATCGNALGSVGEKATDSLPPDEASKLARAAETAEAEAASGERIEAIIDRLEPGTALLVAIHGSNRGARFLLDRETTTVGRHPDSDIFLDDVTVSRRHVEFRRKEDGLRVADLGSTNGTFVNSRRAEEARLGTGDEVQIGKFKLAVLLARAGHDTA
jgi:pSer/pThr/pTyr-binding forkhead associated (FHA) protein